jgi:hypothetical protein
MDTEGHNNISFLENMDSRSSKVDIRHKYFHFRFENFKIKLYKTIILSREVYGCETWSLT